MGELIETNFKKSKNYFYELRNILKLNSHSNKFYGSLYEKQLVQDFIQLNSTCFAIRSIFPFFVRFTEFVGHFSHTCFSNICSNSPSFFNPKFYFVKRIVDIIKTRWAQFTQAFGTFCAERFLISCFVLITWHEDRACRAENCFVFPKLFMANFRSVMKIRRNIALCFGEITRGASENLPEFKISCEQLTKVSDFRFHYFCTTLCLYLHQK